MYMDEMQQKHIIQKVATVMVIRKGRSRRLDLCNINMQHYFLVVFWLANLHYINVINNNNNNNNNDIDWIEHTYTHTTILQPSCILSGTTWVRWHQKGKTRKAKPIWIYCSKRQWVAGASVEPYANLQLGLDITTLTSHHSVFYRPDALPATQPTASNIVQ